MKSINRVTSQTRNETAMRGLKARITQDINSQKRQPTQENILFFERSSAYSEGSALFMI
jgi:hypothetical protein